MKTNLTVLFVGMILTCGTADAENMYSESQVNAALKEA